MKHFLFLLLITLVVSCGTVNPTQATDNTQKKQPATSGFKMDLESVEGTNFSFDSIRGEKHLLIAFWATWCEPCKAELAKLAEMYGEFSDKIEFAAVSTDGEDLVDKVTEFATESALPFPVLLDPSGNFVASVVPGGNSVPYSVIVKKDGTIHSRHSGYKPGDEVSLKNELKELLEKEK